MRANIITILLLGIFIQGCSKKIPSMSFEDLPSDKSALLVMEASTYNNSGAFSVQVGELLENCEVQLLFEKKLEDVKKTIEAKIPADKDLVIQAIYSKKYYNYFQGKIRSTMQDAIVLKSQAKRKYVVRLEVPKKHFREIKLNTLTMSGEQSKAKESERYKGCM